MNVLKILIVLACFFSTVTMAQTPAPSPKPTFKDIDKNGDGKITAAEAKAAGMSDANFKKADKNGDGSLTPEEFFWD